MFNKLLGSKNNFSSNVSALPSPKMTAVASVLCVAMSSSVMSNPIESSTAKLESEQAVSKSVFVDQKVVESTSATSTELTVEKLQQVLQDVSTTHAVSGNLQVSFRDIEEFDGEPRESVGTVGFFISENPNGLTISYDKDVTSAIKLEAASKVEDEEADTPTIDAIREVSTNTINRIFSPISSINSLLTHAKLEQIDDVEQNGQVLKKMTFTMPTESFIRDKQVRKYVDKFDGKLTITATEQGVPVEMATTFEGSGRAYIFFSMKAAGSSLTRYEVVNDRLVMTFSERFNKYESTFGNGENNSVLLFSPQETSDKKADKAYLAKTSNETSM